MTILCILDIIIIIESQIERDHDDKESRIPSSLPSTESNFSHPAGTHLKIHYDGLVDI